jgi:hypothetical protein
MAVTPAAGCMLGLSRGQFSGVGDFTLLHWAHLRVQQGGDRDGFPIECDKLDFESFTTVI